MRAYFFNNMYLQGIQAGIQAQHCTAEMFAKYEDNPYGHGPLHEKIALLDWANNHRTTIILNGGNHSNLDDIYEIIESLANLTTLPFAVFREEGINDAITSVGIIVPEDIYTMDTERQYFGTILTLNPHETCTEAWAKFELATLIKSKRLMN